MVNVNMTAYLIFGIPIIMSIICCCWLGNRNHIQTVKGPNLTVPNVLFDLSNPELVLDYSSTAVEHTKLSLW